MRVCIILTSADRDSYYTLANVHAADTGQTIARLLPDAMARHATRLGPWQVRIKTE